MYLPAGPLQDEDDEHPPVTDQGDGEQQQVGDAVRQVLKGVLGTPPH